MIFIFRPVDRLFGNQNARAQGAAIVVELGLRQIERILALDVAGAHVVADGEPDQLSLRRNDQRQFRLGNRPFRVAADADRLAGTGDAPRHGLEEQLRPRRRIHPVVVRGARFRFLHAGHLAPLVRHPRRPDFLMVERRQHPHLRRGDQRGVGIEQRTDEVHRILRVQQVGQAAAAVRPGDDIDAVLDEDGDPLFAPRQFDFGNCMT